MPFAVAAVALAGLVILGVGAAGRAIVQRTDARTAADAAALAGAAEDEEAARRLAEANGAELVTFERSGDTVVVEVRLGDTTAFASARTTGAPAGPGSSDGPGPGGGVGGEPPPLRTVEGITVHASIAAQVEGLVQAARADGFELAGGGYRTFGEQVALRRQHCGPSQYAIYRMPASQCSPPTARPGSSLHEQGLAIDFSCNGSLIRSRASTCFRWLATNATAFGLSNLPSEPWHWSIDGT